MAKIVVMGAGVAGHTAAPYLRRGLNKSHEVIVIAPNKDYTYIPSNIWVGTGRMKHKRVHFPLAPIYKKAGIIYKQAKVTEFHPEGDNTSEKAFVTIEYVTGEKKGKIEKVTYDYLINSTGPKLNFEGTEGLLPGTNKVVSVCSWSHADHAWKELEKVIKRMKNGEKIKILIGTGHALATCQGAAFEYVLNVESELQRHGVRKNAEVYFITNEPKAGEFGVGGMTFKVPTVLELLTGEDLGAELFEDRGIIALESAGVYKVEDGKAYYETIAGEYKIQEFDFAMLIPQFTGHNFVVKDKNDNDIYDKLFMPNGFMRVDADYTKKDPKKWSIHDWPDTYQNPNYKNIFAPGIAFAPPHTMSEPAISKNGTPIFPAPPRTGMPSGISAKVVADNIVHMIKNNTTELKHSGNMGNMGAACIASAAYGWKKGSAISMTIFPVVADWEKFPETGRQQNRTHGQMGLAGHWIKYALHIAFKYKAKLKPFWWLIPE
jgi:sulfide:quinone oxidoreductase